MAQKPSIPKGTRDFAPVEMMRREYIFETIRRNFKRYGYLPIETPAMENLSTLMGKYGAEGDKLLFKILNSGNFIEKATDFSDVKKLTNEICEKGLRYDLTVPFARFVVQHQNDITFPFKRYQMQPVWRADRPQKGRYREFYQCDADVIGSKSLWNEAELVKLIDDVFHQFDIQVMIKINNRKILAGIAEMIGAPDAIIDITVAIDKLDKIGMEAVIKELENNGISKDAIEKLWPVLNLKGSFDEKITQLQTLLSSSPVGMLGIEELQTTFTCLSHMNMRSEVELDLTLARGLNYYTGAIMEVKAKDVQIGSICGGGRYDDLTGIFGLPNVSGVGISFGADRIYDVLLELSKFPDDMQESTQVMFVNFGPKEAAYAIGLINRLRANNISAILYPDEVKMQKQFGYADANHIPFVAIAGETEINNGQITLKNMKDGSQQTITGEDLLKTWIK